MRPVRVWDLPSRVFHWSLVVLVIVGLLTGEDEGVVYLLHTYVGYLILVHVLFRAGWGVFGTEHARFGEFLFRWPTVRAYLLDLAVLRPPRHLGHNPLGGWMILVLLVTLVVVVLTGMMTHGEEGASGALSWLMPLSLGEVFEEIHEGVANLLIVLVVAHVAGALGHSLLTRDNLVRAMLDGRKLVAESDSARDVRPVNPVVLTGWLVVVVVFGAGLFVWGTP